MSQSMTCLRSAVWAAAIGLLLVTTACGEQLPPTSAWMDAEPVRVEGPAAYVVNKAEDTLSVLSLPDLVEEVRLNIGLEPLESEAPRHVIIDEETGHLFITVSNYLGYGGSGPSLAHEAYYQGSVVQRLDLDDLTQSEWVGVFDLARDLQLTPDGSKLLVTHFTLRDAILAAETVSPPEDGWGPITVLDPATMRKVDELFICNAPGGIAVTPDGSTALVACYAEDSVVYVDLSGDELTVRARVQVGPEARPLPPWNYAPRSVHLLPDGATAFIAVEKTRDVRVLDVANESVAAEAIPLMGKPFYGALDGDGTRLYMPTKDVDGITVIDVETRSISEERQFEESECISPHRVVWYEEADAVLVVCEGVAPEPGRVLLLDASTLATMTEAHVDVLPDSLVIAHRTGS